jgi:hypothetical protein
VPVRLIGTAPAAAPPPPAARAVGDQIEIALPDGSRVLVSNDGGLAPCRGGAAQMIVPPSKVWVWLATGATEMRRGMNGLASHVQ